MSMLNDLLRAKAILEDNDELLPSPPGVIFIHEDFGMTDSEILGSEVCQRLGYHTVVRVKATL